MIRATYETQNGTRFKLESDVRTTDDYLASVSHERRQQAGARLVSLEDLGERGGRAVYLRDLPSEPRVAPDSGDIPTRGVAAKLVRNRRLF